MCRDPPVSRKELFFIPSSLRVKMLLQVEKERISRKFEAET